jgi:hypothetical protein
MNSHFASGLTPLSTDDLDALMDELMHYRRMKLGGQVGILAEQLKVCPVCSAVNQHGSPKCFICSWHGQFETDSVVVEKSLDELILRCPQLLEALLPDPKPQPLSSWKRFQTWFLLRFSKSDRIDLLA